LARVADENVHAVHDTIEKLRCALRWLILKIRQQPALPIFLIRFIYRVDQAIGKNEEDVARTKLESRRVIAKFVLCKRGNPEWRTALVEPLNLAGSAPQDGMIMARVDIDQFSSFDVEFAKKGCGETAAVQTVR